MAMRSRADDRRLHAVFVAQALVFGSGALASVLLWDLTCVMFALVPVVASVHVQERRFRRRRRQYVERLLERSGVDLPEEIERMASTESLQTHDVSRIWEALASFFHIPPDRIRSTDRLDDELDEIWNHPDNDLFLCDLILGHRGPARRAADEMHTWGDLIAVIRQFELERGMSATVEVTDDSGDRRHAWAD